MKTNFLTIAAAIVLVENTVAQRNQRTPADIGFFRGDAYQAQTALEKLDQLWGQCLADDTVLPQPWAATPNLFTQSMQTTFGRVADELPDGRPKINHSQGTVALVSWEDLGGHPYTGLYQGSDTGLIRLSEGNFILPEAPGLTPTLAIKFLRDGMESVNHLANTNFEPSNSWNFFADHFHSRIPLFTDECAQESIQAKFTEATSRVGSVGLAEFARFNEDGSQVSDENIEFPFEIMFAPNQALAEQLGWTDERQEGVSFLQQLTEIPVGEILFEVMARDVPDDIRRFPQGSTLSHIANIRMTSEMVTSDFGDRRLFFQHESTRLDFELKPEFRRFHDLSDVARWGDNPVPDFPEDDETAKAWIRGQLDEYGCPFAWLFNQPFDPIF